MIEFPENSISGSTDLRHCDYHSISKEEVADFQDDDSTGQRPWDTNFY